MCSTTYSCRCPSLRVLFLGIGESVAVIPPDGLGNVRCLACPLGLLPVRLDPVDQLTTAVLEGQGVPVILVHRLQHPGAVTVKVQIRVRNVSEVVQLKAFSAIMEDVTKI